MRSNRQVRLTSLAIPYGGGVALHAALSRPGRIASMALAYAEIVRARSVRWSNGTLSMPRAAGPLCPRHRRRSWRRIKLAFGPEQNQASGESFDSAILRFESWRPSQLKLLKSNTLLRFLA